MPRTARIKSSIGIYHVVIRGADHQLFFEESKDYRKYLDILSYYKEVCNFEIYAYCLMSNHVHLLIKINNFSLETIFRRINTTYAGWFNCKYDRTGFLQQGRYASEPVEDTEYLLNIIRYIHYNPSKAGLEASPGTQYPWSSFYEYLSTPMLINPLPILKIYGNIEHFLTHHTTIPTQKHMDIDTLRKHLPDDVARDLIREESCCETVTDFQNLSIVDRNKYLDNLHKKGISIRQLNRLTGTPRGIIERILKSSKT